MQPGSSIATTLMPGEAVPKYVSILSVKGRDFTTENIRLKTVRPFIMREIVLADDKQACNIAKKRSDDGRAKLTRHLESIVEELIEEAKSDWQEAQEARSQHSDLEDDENGPPLPLIRLRVESSPPEEGGTFDTENPQRFSNRFVSRVANTTDVVQFYKKKKSSTSGARKGNDVPEHTVLTEQLDSVKVEKLVREFLTAQSLTILPQNSFGDAVAQFVDKDDKHAMEMFVNESLANQIKHLMALDHAADGDEDDDEAQDSLQAAMDKYRSQLEDMFSTGSIRRSRKRKLKPKPDTWDSDLDGSWEDQPGALIHTDNEDGDANSDDEDEDDAPIRAPATRGRGRGRGATTTTRGRGAAASKSTPTRKPAVKKPAPAKRVPARGSKRVADSEEEEEASDVMILDPHDDEEEESQGLFVKQSQPSQAPSRSTRTAMKPPARAAAARPKQSTLNFASQASQSQTVEEISDDDEDEDAFEPVPKVAARGRGRGRR
jgi:double-strand break repair protein MRE11